MAGRPAVFVDRDDTLNRDCPYCRRPEDIVLLPGVAAGLHVLAQAGLPVIVVTNQSGIARGYFSEADLAAIHAKLRADVERGGGRIEAFYHCPHHPDAACPCRKPSAEMLHRAAREHGIDLSRSAVIGDRGKDLEMAWNAGCLAVMVPRLLGQQELKLLPRAPDFVAEEFHAAATWVAARLAPQRHPV